MAFVYGQWDLGMADDKTCVRTDRVASLPDLVFTPDS